MVLFVVQKFLTIEHVPRITDFCSCIYVFGCRLRLVRLCDSDFGITPVDDITIRITCVAFPYHHHHHHHHRRRHHHHHHHSEFRYDQHDDDNEDDKQWQMSHKMYNLPVQTQIFCPFFVIFSSKAHT